VSIWLSWPHFVNWVLISPLVVLPFAELYSKWRGFAVKTVVLKGGSQYWNTP